MKSLQNTSLIILVIGIICFLLWTFIFSVPDWIVRVTGIVLMTSTIALVFSSVRIYMNKEK